MYKEVFYLKDRVGISVLKLREYDKELSDKDIKIIEKRLEELGYK